MSERKQQDALSEAFPDDIIKQVQGMDYVPVAEVVSRLNNVLGTNGWSSTIVSIGRDPHSTEYVIAQISISAVIDGKPCVADGVGGKKIAVTRSTGDILDLGKDFKSAYSDSLKKAAQRLGVGLHLARDEEAIHLDEVASYEISTDHWNAANEAVGGLSVAQLEGLKAWWKKNGNGTKPAIETMTTDLFRGYSKMIKELMAESPVEEPLPAEEPVTAEAVAEAFGGKVTDGAPF